ncbi:MAG: hypothetical protein HC836_44220 [Richelia sp. RM2_1_2]|nr:hypothetical protein [Richelia sp. RM2_1_2]
MIIGENVYVTELKSERIFGFIKMNPGISASGDTIDEVNEKLARISKHFKKRNGEQD